MPDNASDGATDAAPASQGLYGEYYYRHDCGLPYERNEHWSRFFGEVADAIVRELRPRSVLDVGCAMGILVEELRVRKVEAWGIDVSEYAIDTVHESVAPYCAVSSAADGSLPEGFPAKFDLVTCVEVVEHLQDSEVLPALKNLTTFADRLLFSSSPEDYTEATHLNVRPPDVWSARLAGFGMWRNLDLDASFLTPWAVVYDRREPVAPELVAAYERAYVLQRREIRALRTEVLRRHADDVRLSGLGLGDLETEMHHLSEVAEAGAARVAELEVQLAAEHARAESALAELTTMTQQLHDERLTSLASNEQMRDDIDRLGSRLSEANVEIGRLEAQCRATESQLDDMRVIAAHRDEMLRSETWRLGSALLSPLRLVRGGANRSSGE